MDFIHSKSTKLRGIPEISRAMQNPENSEMDSPASKTRLQVLKLHRPGDDPGGFPMKKIAYTYQHKLSSILHSEDRHTIFSQHFQKQGPARIGCSVLLPNITSPGSSATRRPMWPLRKHTQTPKPPKLVALLDQARRGRIRILRTDEVRDCSMKSREKRSN